MKCKRENIKYLGSDSSGWESTRRERKGRGKKMSERKSCLINKQYVINKKPFKDMMIDRGDKVWTILKCVLKTILHHSNASGWSLSEREGERERE